MIQDIALAVWGPEDKLGPRAPGFKSFVILFDSRFPTYELLLIAIGPAVLGLLWFLFRRTRWGTLVRAATQDREMVGALGVNQRLLFTSVFAFGAGLAGLGGALQLGGPCGPLGIQRIGRRPRRGRSESARGRPQPGRHARAQALGDGFPSARSRGLEPPLTRFRHDPLAVVRGGESRSRRRGQEVLEVVRELDGAGIHEAASIHGAHRARARPGEGSVQAGEEHVGEGPGRGERPFRRRGGGARFGLRRLGGFDGCDERLGRRRRCRGDPLGHRRVGGAVGVD